MEAVEKSRRDKDKRQEEGAGLSDTFLSGTKESLL